MPQLRSKVVELSGHRFQVRRLDPDAGGFIFWRMMGINMRAAMDAAPPKPSDTPSSEPPTKVTGEMRVRALTFSVFSGGITFEDFKFVQNACMRKVALIDPQISEKAGTDQPMPVMNDAGVWTPQGQLLVDDPGLVMQLTTECLVLAFADFFDEKSPGM